MSYIFTETQKDEIIKKRGYEHYSKILKDIGIYSQKWELSDITFATTSPHNIILFCKSKMYGECVLKLYGLMWEYNALHEYRNSNKFCMVFEFDTETRAMLIERIIPGTMLKNESSLERRMSVFSELFYGLHIKPKHPENFFSYPKWVCDRTEAMKAFEDNTKLYVYALKAKEVFSEMSSVYDKEILLHWDLANENVLLGKDGMYKIIDPMGFVGDPVLDIGRFILKEYWDTDSNKRKETVDNIINYFEVKLRIPKKIIRQCFYIDTIFLNCHMAEIGGTADIEIMEFADIVLNDNRN